MNKARSFPDGVPIQITRRFSDGVPIPRDSGLSDRLYHAVSLSATLREPWCLRARLTHETDPQETSSLRASIFIGV